MKISVQHESLRSGGLGGFRWTDCAHAGMTVIAGYVSKNPAKEAGR